MKWLNYYLIKFTGNLISVCVQIIVQIATNISATQREKRFEIILLLDNFQMNTQTRPAAEMLAEMHTGMLVAPLVRNHDKRESPTAYHTKTENTGDGP